MRCGDPLPLAFDFGSLTAVAAERCSRLPTAAGLRALGWPSGLRPWITARQFSATATGEKDERPGGARNRRERDLGINHLQTPSSH